MIFSRFKHIPTIIIGAILLSACPGQDENLASSGLRLHVAEVHLEQRWPESSLLVQSVEVGPLAGSSTAVSINSTIDSSALLGYDRAMLEHHDIVDSAGHLLSLFKAYLVVDSVELERCATISQLPNILLNSIIKKAHAHAGHGAEQVGGRNLDQPNVIDIVTRDEYNLALGDIAVAPGDYCAIQINLNRLSGPANGKPVPAAASTDDPVSSPSIPDMEGKFFLMRADYCSTPDGLGGCAIRSKVDLDDAGLKLAESVRFQFSQPVSVSRDVRQAYVSIGIAYAEWLNNIDVSILDSDLLERQKLISNIVDSIHIYAKGLGELPANFP